MTRPTNFAPYVILALALAGTSLYAQSKQAPARGAAAPKDSVTSTATRGRQSWTSDRVTFGVGDVITVMIDERTLASAHLSDNASAKRTKDLGLNVSPPGSGAVPSIPIAGSASFGSDGNSNQRGDVVRENNFASAMSARVVAVSPNGSLQIKGTKIVTVDKSKQEIMITGWIRAQDISPATNSVVSTRLADAEITYGQKGALGKPKSGMLGKLFGAIWP